MAAATKGSSGAGAWEEQRRRQRCEVMAVAWALIDAVLGSGRELGLGTVLAATSIGSSSKRHGLRDRARNGVGGDIERFGMSGDGIAGLGWFDVDWGQRGWCCWSRLVLVVMVVKAVWSWTEEERNEQKSSMVVMV
ncbi:hypothetical protein M0R45_002315 [Rubus argutus]|uniref:Uncharacterized protein n=1 Tax=Rubus argutus TaxID=59490 RepID=A0AAW1VHP5_RUBAR